MLVSCTCVVSAARCLAESGLFSKLWNGEFLFSKVWNGGFSVSSGLGFGQLFFTAKYGLEMLRVTD